MELSIKTQIGRLRLISYLEGISLLILIGIAMPVKYIAGNPSMVKAMGPVHGMLFVLFIFNTLSVGVEHQWKFRHTTWKVLLACIIPFGTFYIDKHILSRVAEGDAQKKAL
ncbi:integral membrane protein [Chitinophaga costaii]|uniref:Integral membrane protein n=1 Tax=Chitinophaga costaii TaxID=1335309 RepID=A0A1C4FXL0_9BACT|nr:DUF3817 domain-containing protein [Chitinophaga costaii]PUZ20893.1 DUF3817 domain-containing protein [Chitinophaga costaii]SCC60604.1 integral membrane protein [Chitinophaga costaii]